MKSDPSRRSASPPRGKSRGVRRPPRADLGIERVFESIGDGICILDAEGRIVRCNAAMLSLLGESPPAIEGRPCWEAIHRGGGPAEECPFLRARISLRRESATLVLRGRRFGVVVDPIVGRDGRFAGGVHTLLALEGQAGERIASLAALPGENPNPVLDCRADGAIIYMNPAAERLFPSLREEKLRHPFLAGIGALPAAPARGGPRAVQRVVACGEARYLQTISSRPGEGRFRVYGVDITGHALARENLARLNRTYRVISRINDAIVRSADRRVLFDTACRIMVEEGGFRMAWIGIMDEEARAVRPVSWFGRGAERYLGAVKISYDESPSGSGPAGLSVRENRYRVSGDIAADPAMGPWRDACAAMGYRSSASFPLSVGGRPVGLFAFYSSSTGWFGEEEVTLLDGLAHNLSHAIEAFEGEGRRRRAEEQVRESEERFRAIFDQVAVGVAETSLEGRWLRVNRRLCDIMGYTREEMLGTTYMAMTHPDDVARSVDQTRRLAAGEFPTYAMEKRYIRKDGSPIWCAVAVSLVRGAAGEPRYTIAVINDITEQKRLQEHLLHARKIETVGRLAGGVAHDFNNYLTLILNYALSAARSLPPDSPVQEDMAEIVKGVEKSIRLTRQLLAFSRRQVIVPKVIALNEVVEDIGGMVRHLVGGDIEFSTDLAPDLGLVKADSGAIEQVIVNLVVNARDAMPRGGKLVIRTANAVLDGEYARNHVDVAPGEYVMLAVSDSGGGMSGDVKSRIFEPFFTTKGAGEGTGLGLPTVHGIVAQHGGHIEVSSEPGSGAVFRIYLPRFRAAGADAAAGGAPAGAPRGSETVLVVENDLHLLRVTSRMLRECGYRVIEAFEADDGLRLAEEHKDEIGLILADVAMPGMGGVELAARAGKSLPGVKILFMSGYPERIIALGGKPGRGVGILSKPFTPAALARKVREALDAPEAEYEPDSGACAT